MSWQSTPLGPHWQRVNVDEKYRNHWKLVAETERYDGRRIVHYITLVAESDEDCLEAAEFLETAEYKGLYNPSTCKIDLGAFERHEFAWGRIGADSDEDFVEVTKEIQFNGEIFISPLKKVPALPNEGQDLEGQIIEAREELSEWDEGILEVECGDEVEQENKVGGVALEEIDAAVAEKEAAEQRLVVLAFQNAKQQNRIIELENENKVLQLELQRLQEGLQQNGSRQIPPPRGATPRKRCKHVITDSRGEGKVSRSKHRRQATPDVQQQPKRHREMSSDDDSEGAFEPQPKKVKRGNASGQPKVNRASGSTANSKPRCWSAAEKIALATEMRLYKEENADKPSKDLLHDAKLFGYMSSLLARKYGIHRSGNGCKNEWNRYGREKSGIENRTKTKPKSRMSTSIQVPRRA